MTEARLKQLRSIVTQMNRVRATKNRVALTMSRRNKTPYEPILPTQIEERYRQTLLAAELYFKLSQDHEEYVEKFRKFKEK